MKLVMVFMIITLSLSAAQCPGVFRRSSDEFGRWLGELILRSEFTLSGIWIRIEFDKKVQLLGSTFDADIKTEDNQSFLFRNPDFILHKDETVTVPFFVRYSELEVAPELRLVRLNGRVLCPAPSVTTRISPCPSVLLYDEKEEVNRWYATLNLSSDVELQEVWVTVELDSPAELIGSKFGEVKAADNQEFIIFKHQHTIKPGTPLRIPFFVKYSELEAIPSVQAIRLNSRTICGPLIEHTNTATK